MSEQNATNKPYVIGLDLRGTNSVFGIVDARGDIKATTAIKTGNIMLGIFDRACKLGNVDRAKLGDTHNSTH